LSSSPDCDIHFLFLFITIGAKVRVIYTSDLPLNSVKTNNDISKKNN
jgi:hypothetical protein